MKAFKEKINIISPINQLCLFGYDNYFHSFINLYKNKKLPHTMLFSGPKGLGKSTFVYHFINYIFSYNEEKKYSLKNFTINPENKSYKLLINNSHPNLFLLDSSSTSDQIKIDQVRNLLKFLSKSSFLNNTKVILIDNSESLNLNSSNALLKVLEEAPTNTFFFIIHNNSLKILNTIESRSIKFNFSFSIEQKKDILNKLINIYNLKLDVNNLADSFYFETSGNLLKFLMIFDNTNIDFPFNKLESFFYIIEKYQTSKDSQLLSLASLIIEQYYHELSLINNKNINIYFNKRNQILKNIYETKKFNLDKKNLLISMKHLLNYETK